MRRVAWACCRAWWLGWLLLAALLPARAADDAVLRLEQAEFIAEPGGTAPADTVQGQPVQLPQSWRRARGGAPGAGWYRLRFDAGPVPAMRSVYLPSVCCVVEVHVNGELVGRAGTPERPLMLTVPLRYDVPAALLRPGSNRVDVRLTHGRYTGTVLGPVEVGPPDVLAPRERARWWLATGLSQMAVPLALTFGVFALLAWLRRRSEQMLGYFGLSSLAFAVYASDWLFVQPPVALSGWLFVTGGAAMSINVLSTLTAMRYAGLRWRRAEWVLWALIPLALFHIQMDFRWWGARVFGTVWLYAPLMYIAAFGLAAWRRRTVESVLLFIASSGCLGASLWMRSGAAPVDGIDIHCYAFLPLQLLIVWMLVQRHVAALGAAERLNVQLERRVAEKVAEVQAGQARMEQLAREAAVAEERRRIMSDMHDGIGSQLITTLGLVEHGTANAADVAAALRECIDDLRLAIDSLEPTEQELLPVLGNLRYRLEPRLRQQHIELDWQVQEVPRLACLTPQNVLHVLRILQEAFTNVVKHAHATRIRVATAIDRGHVAITVADNGRGFGSEPAGAGHGLSNMRERSRRIGGELQLESTASGTSLSLRLPIA